MSVRKHRKIGGRYHWSNCLLFDYEFLLRWMTAGYSSLTYNVPYRVDKFKSSFPEIRQVKVPIPSEMDR